MRFNIKFFSAALLVAQSVMARVEDPCNAGKYGEGICLKKSDCKLLGKQVGSSNIYVGSSPNWPCPKDPDDVICCAIHVNVRKDGVTKTNGDCLNVSQCSSNKLSGECPGSSSVKLCLNNSKPDTNTCTYNKKTYNCMNPSNCNGRVIVGLCPGGADNRCCVTDNDDQDFNGDYTINVYPRAYKQADQAWGYYHYAGQNRSCTIGNSGCLITSLTMVYNTYYNKRLTPIDYATGYMSFNGCAASYYGSSFKYYNANLQSVLQGLKSKSMVVFGSYYLENGKQHQHYVVVYDYIGTNTNNLRPSDFLIHDPGYKRTSLDQHLSQYPYYHQVVYIS